MRTKMDNIIGTARRAAAAALISAVLSCGLIVNGQDLVPVSDITGGSSVFVFRGSARPTPRRSAARVRAAVITKTQRLETARRVTVQYAKLIKIAPRRS